MNWLASGWPWIVFGLLVAVLLVRWKSNTGTPREAPSRAVDGRDAEPGQRRGHRHRGC